MKTTFVKRLSYVFFWLESTLDFLVSTKNVDATLQGHSTKKIHISCPTGLKDHIKIFDGNK